jgi:hypothetical protein
MAVSLLMNSERQRRYELVVKESTPLATQVVPLPTAL